jgi:hypothetical protein
MNHPKPTPAKPYSGYFDTTKSEGVRNRYARRQAIGGEKSQRGTIGSTGVVVDGKGATSAQGGDASKCADRGSHEVNPRI